MNIAAQSFSPRTDDAKGVGTGLLGYARAAPVDAHLGWLPEQLEAAAQDAGSSLKDSRPLKQVLAATEHGYQISQRGLNAIAGELFADARIRIEQYIRPLKTLSEKFFITDPAKAGDPLAWRQAAKEASESRNQIMKNVRQQLSAKGLAASESAKKNAPIFKKLWKKNEIDIRKTQGAAYAAMPAAQKDIAISQKIIEGAGKSDPTFNAITQNADGASRSLKALKHGGRALAVVGAVMDGVSVTRQVQESMKTGHWDNTGKEVSRVAGGWLGAAAAGALVGSASGSIVPVLGNVTGFLVGAAAGAVGYWLGSRGGEAAYQAVAH